MKPLRVLAFFAVLSLAATACQGASIVTQSSLQRQLAQARAIAAQGRSAMQKLRTLRVGKSGFYYVIDCEGRVLSHPQPALIGQSFKGIWFTAKIIGEKKGCLRYQLGNRTHLILFDEADECTFVCLSILADELFSQPDGCPIMAR